MPPPTRRLGISPTRAPAGTAIIRQGQDGDHDQPDQADPGPFGGGTGPLAPARKGLGRSRHLEGLPDRDVDGELGFALAAADRRSFEQIWNFTFTELGRELSRSATDQVFNIWPALWDSVLICSLASLTSLLLALTRETDTEVNPNDRSIDPLLS